MIGPQLPDEPQAEVTLRTVRQFAGIALVFFGALFALSWYRHSGHPTVFGWIAGTLAILIGVPGLIFPALIRPVYLGAMFVTKPIGHLISIVLLGIIYFGLMTPLAVVFRWMKRDNLARRRLDVPTYWTPKPEPSDPESYLRQYYKQ